MHSHEDGATSSYGGQDEPGPSTVTVEAGLDALETPRDAALSGGLRLARFVRVVLPPLAMVVLLVVVWQVLWAAALWPEYQLPAPAAVGRELWDRTVSGDVGAFLWTSLHRAVLGFLMGLGIATPLGLLVAKVRVVRRAVGPLLSGLQNLPSIAWVPAAILWFGITPATVYCVILLGSVPSIANGLVAGIDQVPPILSRVGQVLGAGRFATVWHILLPAALPGYVTGVKQGWAFSWRSLMGAELIATSPQLGVGLGQYLQQGRNINDMPSMLSAIALILAVGVAIELLVFRPLERSVFRARGLGEV